MMFAPFPFEAKVLIAERASERDPPGVRNAAGKRRRIAFQPAETRATLSA